MNNDEPLLKVRFDGRAVGEARISVAHLLRFLEQLTKALQRTGRVLQGDANSVRKGAPSRSIADEVALDLVLLTHGSPAAVLGFERRCAQPGLEGLDFGIEVLERALSGLESVQTDENEALPPGFDAGVLMAWRDTGGLFSQGIDQIELRLNSGPKPLIARYTPNGLARIQRLIQGPQKNIRAIEGRLLMADFKERGTRCRVHPAAAEPVVCVFDESQREEVLEDMLRYVRVVGEATEDAFTGKIVSIKIHDIQRLEDKENQATDLLPQGTPLPPSFWQSASLDELARAQRVSPMTDVSQLFGSWPGEADDDFETLIGDLRHSDNKEGYPR